ncbi:MAG: PAS domain-containing protein [Proteobacteria bacterium]|nr:PAS domain-containing protein [Pseudomonadota bacterium]
MQDEGRSREPLLAEVESLRQRLSALSAVLEAAPVGLCMVDRDLRFLYVNDWLAAINGRPAAEHIGATVAEVLPEIANQMIARYRLVLETGEPILNGEITALLPSAPEVEHTWLVNDHPVFADDGSVEGIVTSIQDVSDRKQIERELRLLQERLLQAHRVAKVGSWDWDLTRDRMWWSPETYELFGIDLSEQPTYDLFFEQVHPEDRQHLRNQLERALVEPGAHAAEYRVIVEGRERVYLAALLVERDANGEPVRLFGTLQDITQRVAAAEYLERDRKRLAELLEQRTRQLDRVLARRGRRS